MLLFEIKENKLEEIKEVSFTKELELHKLCESNLNGLFGLQFVRRELVLCQYFGHKKSNFFMLHF